jgi:uncharacterized protein YcaQ
MPRTKITLPEARRIALAAQGFDRDRPNAPINSGHIRRVIDRLGLLQLDYVNVLVPAHLMVLFSRLGPYEISRFHQLVYQGRDFTEQWAHEASIVPSALWPVLEHRRHDYRPYPNSPIMTLKGKSTYLKEVLEITKETAPLTSQDLPAFAGPKRKPGDWHRSVPRWALEYHFGRGDIAVANRLPNFQRVYDLPERLIDDHHREQEMSREEAERELLRRAANASGIATLHDLADYYRMSAKDAAPRIAELVEAGDITEVAVEGWQSPAYLAKSAKIPHRIGGASLLSPFDPVVWFRPRAERLFDFYYRIEIYVPANKRKWGYYVLPFLLDDRIVARVDLKADRKNRALLVPAAHAEANIDEDCAVHKLAGELRVLADWLQLDRIKVSRRGPFARKLADYLRDDGGVL